MTVTSIELSLGSSRFFVELNCKGLFPFPRPIFFAFASPVQRFKSEIYQP